MARSLPVDCLFAGNDRHSLALFDFHVCLAVFQLLRLHVEFSRSAKWPEVACVGQNSSSARPVRFSFFRFILMNIIYDCDVVLPRMYGLSICVFIDRFWQQSREKLCQELENQ